MMGPDFEKTLEACKRFGFSEQITREMLWNEGYALGRKRWYWGPAWWVSVMGWVNTQLSKLRLRK